MGIVYEGRECESKVKVVVCEETLITSQAGNGTLWISVPFRRYVQQTEVVW